MSCRFGKNATVLDVGCGDGKITGEIALKIPAGRVLGIDASPNMIRLAKTSFQMANLEFRCMKAEELDLPYFFDYIFCFNCLLWIRKPREALKRMSKLLSPGGKLLILTYLKDSSYVEFLEKTLQKFPSYKKLSAYHTMLSLEEHRDCLEQNGLQIQTFEVRNMTSSYTGKLDLKNYLRGWLGSYVPIPAEQENEFLDRAVDNSYDCSIHRNSSIIELPYKALIIKASKPRKNHE